MEKIYRYKKLEFNEREVNELGSDGWRIISVLGSSVIMEQEGERKECVSADSLLPVSRTILDPNAIYKCVSKVKRYDWGNSYEHTEFLTIEEFKNQDFYTDDGEYEAFLSDGYYFIGTNIAHMSGEELDEFIKKNKYMFSNPGNLQVYYIDYPEDK